MRLQMRPEGSTRADAMLAQLKRDGLKLTPQRIAIVRELADDLSHPTAQDLFERLRVSFPTMSFATVYNTLDALARCGLSTSLHLGGPVRFDPNVSPHHHAVCDKCGAITDLHAPSRGGARSRARVLELPPTSSSGETLKFQVRAEERIYRGLCGRCSIA